MPDFGARWKVSDLKPIGSGGQGKAFKVTDAKEPNGGIYVAKVSNGAAFTSESSRWKRIP